MKHLKRKWIVMDEKGRVTIPDYMRDAFGLPKGEDFPLIIEAYPSLEDCKTLFLKKGFNQA